MGPRPTGLAIFLLFWAMVFLGGCFGEDEQATQQAPKPSPVTVLKVVAKDAPVSTEFVGKTASSRRVEIRSRVEGFLQSRVYEEGAVVQEGQVMFQMDRKPFEAQLQAAKAELGQQLARQTTADADLARAVPLAKKDAIAERELDYAMGNSRSAAAAVESAQAKVVQAELNLGYTTIHAPVTGLSSFAKQQEGAYIGFGTNSLLTYVARIDPIWVEFSISENLLLHSQKSQKEGLFVPPADQQFEVEIVLADGTLYPEVGRITFADASLSEETGTFLLRAELPNPPRDNSGLRQLRPGQFVRVHLKGGVRPNAILVPQRAVQQGAKGSFVWVIDAENKAEFRPIEVGDWQGDEWFVTEGLEDGETVVVDGALKLRAGVEVAIVEPEAKEAGTPAQTAKAQ
jgi:membrane fusion protein (multidrug efflux system)